VNDGAPFCLNPYQNKPAITDATDSAEDGAEDGAENKGEKKARTAMSLAERLRRAMNDDNFVAFAAFADSLAKTGTPIATIFEQYVAANK
jgi:hypothetical protein